MSARRGRAGRRQLAWAGRSRSLLDDIELIIAKGIGRDVHLWEAILLRLALLVIVAVLLVTILPPLAQGFGSYMAQQMQHALATPTPAP
jgi:hypothetical protein